MAIAPRLFMGAVLKEAGVYYLATMDGDQPRVRPFGAALLLSRLASNDSPALVFGCENVFQREANEK